MIWRNTLICYNRFIIIIISLENKRISGKVPRKLYTIIILLSRTRKKN